MPEDLKSRWVEKLRSGEYHQTVGSLKYPAYGPYGGVECVDGYCCLGVLCLVDNPETEFKWTGEGLDDHFSRPSFPNHIGVKSFDFFLKQQVETMDEGCWREMPLEKALAKNNDAGAKFGEIADWIEENL